jgi:hypothetical protein
MLFDVSAYICVATLCVMPLLQENEPLSQTRRCWVRPSDLYRVKALKRVLARPTVRPKMEQKELGLPALADLLPIWWRPGQRGP